MNAVSNANKGRLIFPLFVLLLFLFVTPPENVRAAIHATNFLSQPVISPPDPPVRPLPHPSRASITARTSLQKKRAADRRFQSRGNLPPADRRLVGHEPEAQFGAGLNGVGDVNGDGLDDVIIPSPFAKPGGSAALFLGTPQGLSEEPVWSYACTNAGSYFGATASAGDINQDGFDDVLIGAPEFSNTEKGQGRVYLFLGSSTGLARDPAWIFEGDGERAKVGFAFDGAGDINGDGFSDVLIGADYGTSVGSKAGRAYLFFGSRAGLADSPAWTVEGSALNLLGGSVGGAGDVNGDGYDDIIISAPGVSKVREGAGEVYIYYGGPNGPNRMPNWTMQGTDYFEGLANRVGRAGDVNGDGFSDVFMAILFVSVDQEMEGVVFVLYGGPNGPSGNPVWFAEGNGVRLRFGLPSGAGDINGDGFDDLLIGVPYAKNLQENEGTALLYSGSPGGLGLLPAWSGESNDPFSYYGAHVHAAGDINGDGYGDVLVGEQPYSHGTDRPGRAYIYYGTKAGLRNDSGWRPVAGKFGFMWKSVALPFPNLAWRGFVLSVIIGGAIWLAVVYRALNRTRAALAAEATARALDQERARIARDLHDNLGTYLARINVAGEIAKSQLNHPENASTQLDNIVRNARTAAQALSEVAWASDPQGDTLDNLVGYLSNFAGRFAQETPIQCQLEFPSSVGRDSLPPGFRQNIFLSFKEAFTNVLRHSKATHVSVRVHLEQQTLAISIDDNGCGFNPDRVPTGHNGLRHLRQRLSAIGGTADILSNAEQGTSVRLLVKLPSGGERPLS